MRFSSARGAFASVIVLASALSAAETVGYPATPRSFVDTAYSINFLDPTQAFANAGLVTTWNLMATNTGDVSLRVWRPVAGGYRLIGVNDFTLSATGAVSLAVVGAAQISVLPNDIIGFHYGSGGANPLAPKVIPCDYVSAPAYIYQTNWPANDVAIGSTLSSGALGDDGRPRVYSLNATTSPVPEPTPLALLVLGLVGALRRRAKT